MENKNDAELILQEVFKSVEKLMQKHDLPEDYISYVLFRFTSNHLLKFLGENKFKELLKEIIN